MKKATLKSLFISLGLLIPIVLTIMAIMTIAENDPNAVTQISPADNAYLLNNTVIHPFTCNMTSNSTHNITQVSLLSTLATNLSVDMSINETSYVNINGTYLVTFNRTMANGTSANFTDDGVYRWNCRYTVNESANLTESRNFFGSNRTVHADNVPEITINTPASGYWDNNTFTKINFSVSGDTATFSCYVWSNETTGNFTEDASHLFTTNNKTNLTNAYTANYEFLEKAGTNWNIKCYESNNTNVYDWSLSNRTINIDRTKPVVSLHNPKDDSYDIDGSVDFRFSLVDANPVACRLFGNFNMSNSSTSGYGFITNSTLINQSNLASNINATISIAGLNIFGLAAGYSTNWSVLCNDSASNLGSSVNYTFITDQIVPNITAITNQSSGAWCDKWNVSWNTSEVANGTLRYGKISNQLVQFNYSTRVNLSHQAVMTNWTAETPYFVNITACDIAGNCNDTYNLELTTPLKLCTGWNYLNIYDGSISMSSILGNSSGDFIYFWNATRQSWVYHTAGGTDNANFQLGLSIAEKRPYALIYENTNSTWFRNITGRNTTSYYAYNISSGDNFLALMEDYTFYNLTQSFENATNGFWVGSTITNIVKNETIITVVNGTTRRLTNFSGSYSMGIITSSVVITNASNSEGGVLGAANYTVYTNGSIYFNMTDDATITGWGSASLNISYNYLGITSFPLNITDDFIYWAAYNNSNDRYANHIYEWLWENSTVIGKSKDAEVAWVWSNVNVTWNGTHITGNWTDA